MTLEPHYGDWTVIGPQEDRQVLCRCICGHEQWIWVSNLTTRKSTSCRYSHDVGSLEPGDTVGEWTVLSHPKPYKERPTNVRCSCGLIKQVSMYSLLKRDSTSCGHGRLTGPRTRLHWMWKWMHSRCYNSMDPMFPYYGERGIYVCSEWHTFDPYFEWAINSGFKKSSGLQIDRINNDGPYSPENCRVVSIIVNANNKSNNQFITAFGETKTVGEWVRDHRCQAHSYSLLWARVFKLNWNPEKAVKTPTRSKKKT